MVGVRPGQVRAAAQVDNLVAGVKTLKLGNFSMFEYFEYKILRPHCYYYYTMEIRLQGLKILSKMHSLFAI